MIWKSAGFSSLRESGWLLCISCNVLTICEPAKRVGATPRRIRAAAQNAVLGDVDFYRYYRLYIHRSTLY